MNYHMLATRNLAEARQIGEAWAQTYPRDALPHVLLSGYVYKGIGQYEKALAEARKGLALDPDFSMAHYNVAVNLAYRNHLDQAEGALRRAAARSLEIEEFLMLEFDLAFLKDDHRDMERVAALARERSAGASWVTNKEAFALAYSGHVQQATGLFRRSVAQAEEADHRERAALWLAGAAVCDAFFGQIGQANQDASSALALSRDRETEYGVALGFALSGNNRKAEDLASDLARRFPDDTSVRSLQLPARSPSSSRTKRVGVIQSVARPSDRCVSRVRKAEGRQTRRRKPSPAARLRR